MEALFAAQAGTAGRKTARLNGIDYEILGGAVDYNTNEVEGASAFAGHCRFSIRVADCPKRPEQLDPVEIGGIALQVMQVTQTNGLTWDITAGDVGME